MVVPPVEFGAVYTRAARLAVLSANNRVSVQGSQPPRALPPPSARDGSRSDCTRSRSDGISTSVDSGVMMTLPQRGRRADGGLWHGSADRHTAPAWRFGRKRSG